MSEYRNCRLVLNSRYGDFTSLKLHEHLRGGLVSRVWSDVGGAARRWETSSPNDAFKGEGLFSPGRARHLCPSPPEVPLKHDRTRVRIPNAIRLLRPPLLSAYEPSTHPDYQRCFNTGEGTASTYTLLYRMSSLAIPVDSTLSADEDQSSCQRFVSYNFVAFVYYDTDACELVTMRME